MDTVSRFIIPSNESLANCDLDNNFFGPAVHHCRGDFDFTLLFEQSILSIGPSALLLLVIPFRALYLSRKSAKVRHHPLHLLKIAASLILGALQLALLVLCTQISISRTKVSIAAASLGVLDAFSLCLLSHVEHTRSIRPSTIICAYLFISSLLDAVQCRTLGLESDLHLVASLLLTILIMKLLMLSLEIQDKRRILQPVWQQLSPESTSGILSRGIFWWLNDLLREGFRKTLSVETIYSTDEKLESRWLLQKLQRSWEKQKRIERYSLLFCVLESMRYAFLNSIFPRFCLIGFKFAQPFLINRVIVYVEQGGANSKNVGYGLIGATGLIYVGLATTTGFYQHTVFRSLTMIRGALISQIYSKTLKLDAIAASTKGSATLTLMSTDVDRICSSFESLHEIWANPIEIALAIWLLERQLGVGCIAPSLTVIFCTLAALRLSNFMGPARKKWNEAVQERVAVTLNIISSMKEVKLLGLVDSWLRNIQALRIKELNLSKKFRMLIVYMNVIGNTPSMIAPMLTFGIFILVSSLQTGQTLTIAIAFTSLSIISLLTAPLAQLLSAIPDFAGSLGCFDRIQKFLLSDDYNDYRVLSSKGELSGNTPSKQSTEDGIELSALSTSQKESSHIRREVITVQNGSFAMKRGNPSVLKCINIQVLSSTLTVIIGKVGSGKSTLLRGLLGEICYVSGSVQISYRGMAYCDQSSWLTNSTVKQNIIGQSGEDEIWYHTVIHACALDKDLSQFPEGDQLMIGSNGLSLSGGQKQRVALARALYSRKEVLIIDDILSGLDWATQDLVWSRVFSPTGLLRQHGTTIILATHTLRHLRDADNIIVLGDEGQVIEQGNFSNLERHNSYIDSLFNDGEVYGSSRKVMNEDIAYQPPQADPPRPQNSKMDEQRDSLRRSGDISLYTYYLKSIGWRYSITGLILSSIATFFGFFPQIWLKYWAQADAASPGTETGMYYGIYAMFAIVGLFFLGFNIWFMFVITIPKSAQNLHLKLLKTVLSAPLSFFVITDSGNIINRFSQDMSLIDMDLPSSLFSTVSGALSCLAGAILMMIGARYLAAIAPIALVALYFLQMFYLRTSRQIRHLELETKSPLYTHFTETLSGLVPIRAFGWQAAFQDINIKLLDTSQKPYYLLYCIQRWLNLVLDLLVAALAVLIVTFAVLTTDTTSAGAIGVALANILGFNQSLASLISSWTSLETSLGAIARLRNFEIDTPAEPKPLQPKEPPRNWPSHGRLEIDSITASYTPTTGPVLHELSLVVEPGEKIAICGRTGSGKSSLLLALFRILDLSSGAITLDGIDIVDVPQNLLRSRLIAIPQEPVIFHGNLRFNIMPQGRRYPSHLPDDQVVITALEKVELWNIVASNGGLDADMSTIPLSHGQKQLFCFARAILLKDSCMVLVLDEAVSSVDQETETLMVKVIQEEFAQHTVISIVHKLNTVMEFDRVAVLETGKIVEIGKPSELIHKEGASSRGFGIEKCRVRTG